MNTKSRIIENIKTILIFLLLILLGFNLYNLFMQNSTPHKTVKNEDEIKFETKDYLKPYKLRFSSGNQNYFMFNELDEKLCDELLNYFIDIISNSYQVKKIQNINSRGDNLSMLVFYYSTNIDRDLFYKNDEKQSPSEMNTIKDIYFIADKTLQVVVYTGSDYYILKPNDREKIKTNIPINNFTERIKELISSSSLRYRQAEYIVSGNEEREYENAPLFICRGYYSPVIYNLEPEYDLKDFAVSSNIVNKVFEARAPFVKEAENTEGDKIYLSEHGSEILKISSNGRIEYKLEDYETKNISSLDEDFLTALKFEAKISGENSNLRLEKYVELDKSAYFEREFYFSKNDKVGRIYSNFDDNGIYIKIDGGKVVEYNRYLPSFQKLSNSYVVENGITYEQKTILKILQKDKTFTKLEEIYSENYGNPEKVNSKEILSKITSIDFGYYEAYKDNIRPCYVVKLGNARIIIDFYSEEGVFDELG